VCSPGLLALYAGRVERCGKPSYIFKHKKHYVFNDSYTVHCRRRPQIQYVKGATWVNSMIVKYAGLRFKRGHV
jgi:hypothetical protein